MRGDYMELESHWYESLGGKLFLGGIGLLFAAGGIGNCVSNIIKSSREERKVIEYDMDSNYKYAEEERLKFLADQLKDLNITSESRAEILKEVAKNPR